ncbi:uncharacterized protein [Drosophila takahashii]|uniref:uncharacterized protein n=1 Tax=Drosophila takahashii TaxID=29030 RepID=UPI003898F3B6
MNNQTQKYCESCRRFIPVGVQWNHHARTANHKMNAMVPLDGRIKMISDGFKGRILHYMFVNEGEELRYPEEFLFEAGEALKSHLFNVLQSYMSGKVNFELFAEYMLVKDDDLKTETKQFQSKMEVVTNHSDLDRIFTNHSDHLKIKMEEFQERDSGWTLLRIIRLEMNFNQFKPLSGSSFIPTPPKLFSKKAIINVQNKNDSYCFKWTLISALTKVASNPSICYTYKVDIRAERFVLTSGINLDFSGLTFPLKIKDIDIFIQKNVTLSINVFGYDEESETIIGPLYQSGVEKPTHINILFLEGNGFGHYTWIKNISKLMTSQRGSHNGREWFCNTCLNFSSTASHALRHKELCSGKVATLPSPYKSTLKYTALRHQLKVPFAVYADFECILRRKNIDLR